MGHLNYLTLESSSILSCYASPVEWLQSGWAHNYLLIDVLLSPDVAAICKIPFTLLYDRAMTFTQFLPIIKEKGLDFTY